MKLVQFFLSALQMSEILVHWKHTLGQIDQFLLKLTDSRTISLLKMIIEVFPKCSGRCNKDNTRGNFFWTKIEYPGANHIIDTLPSSKNLRINISISIWRKIEPSTKLSLFLVLRAISMDRFHEVKLTPLRAWETRLNPGWSDGWRKKGLNSSTATMDSRKKIQRFKERRKIKGKRRNSENQRENFHLILYWVERNEKKTLLSSLHWMNGNIQVCTTCKSSN